MSSCINHWDNGEIGSDYIRVRQYSTRGQKIYTELKISMELLLMIYLPILILKERDL